MTNLIEIEVACLSGYLNGIVSLNGKIRDYNASSFLVEANEVRPDDAITNFFLPHADLDFTIVKKLTNGLRDLEYEIRPFFINNILNIDQLTFNKNDIEERRKYLSFRIMDMISRVLGNAGHSTTSVYRLEGSCKESPSTSIFFCIAVGKYFLVLQFNNNKKFVDPTN